MKFLDHFLHYEPLSPVFQQVHLANNSEIHGHPSRKKIEENKMIIDQMMDIPDTQKDIHQTCPKKMLC